MWTEEDRAAALAWQDEQAALCAGCGLPTDETMTPAAEGNYIARALKCHACAARATSAEDFDGRDGGLYWMVERR